MPIMGAPSEQSFLVLFDSSCHSQHFSVIITYVIVQFEPVKCLDKGHKAEPMVRLKTATPRSRF